MTIFEKIIFIYFISISALAGFAVLWRNWLQDHQTWKEWLQRNLGTVSGAFTCGSCFTFWSTFFFVIFFNPLGQCIAAVLPFAAQTFVAPYAIEWMSIGWGAVFFRFLYVALQESVNKMVHINGEHHH